LIFSEKRETIRNPKVQLLRIEQLYPFPVKKLASFLKRFKNADEFIWCQEEPENMGAWSFVEKYINWTLDSVGAKSKKSTVCWQKTFSFKRLPDI
jgi:2-oxoglutarate dehydrogenase E1 component